MQDDDPAKEEVKAIPQEGGEEVDAVVGPSKGFMWLFSGLDLSGNPEHTYSSFITAALLGESCFESFSAYSHLVGTDMMTTGAGSGVWGSLILCLCFLAYAFGMTILFSILAIANMRGSVHNGIPPGALALLTLYFTLTCADRWRQDSFPGYSAWITMALIIEVIHWSFYVVVVYITICRRCGNPQGRSDAIMVHADERGDWQTDDVVSLIKAAGVPDDVLNPDNLPLIHAISFGAAIREFCLPAPFRELNQFADATQLEEFAKRARIVYPARLYVAAVLGGGLLLMATLAITINSAEVFTNGGTRRELAKDLISYEDYETTIANLDEELLLQNATLQQMYSDLAVVMTLLPSSNFTGNTANNPVLVSAITDLRGQVVTVQLLVRSSATLRAKSEAQEKSITFWEKIIYKAALGLVYAGPITGAVCLWFVYALFPAYRKSLIELVLSRPHFRFHPDRHNFIQDKKFVGIVVSSLLLTFVVILLLIIICVVVLASEALWTNVWEKRRDLITFCIYEAIVLVLIPELHRRCVSKNSVLVHPRVQAFLMFVWETFYIPQCVISVLCQLCVVTCAALVMFLRPDRCTIPNGWEVCDMTHTPYGAAQHEQIRSAIRASAERKPAVVAVAACGDATL
eukprot:NODE_3670_length_2002_cov_2.055467.p1 GENE.NODE_3670_length_2002_cov_2.055467~~NODE_3670_length_2002_cov_2.055467.p1  ORF type:complete len:631 (+),score=90.29 NODE_3670_length_2002_cov_2.055467:89-1981(+)